MIRTGQIDVSNGVWVNAAEQMAGDPEVAQLVAIESVVLRVPEDSATAVTFALRPHWMQDAPGSMASANTLHPGQERVLSKVEFRLFWLYGVSDDGVMEWQGEPTSAFR